MFGRAWQIVPVFFSLVFLIAAAPTAHSGETSNLRITIKQIKNGNGQILICLFQKPNDFPSCTGDGSGVKAYGTKAKKGSVTLTLNNLPVGVYAISAAHDQNNDGKIDKHFLFGYPTEGAGMSNYPKPLRSKPEFKTARFQLTKEPGAVEVIMHYP